MLTLDKPIYLFLLILLPFLIYHFYYKRDRGGSIPYSFDVWNGETSFRTPGGILLSYMVTEILYWLALLLFVFALAGPSLSTEKRIFSERGMDIMIVLDKSPSMAARDFGAEDRLTTAREMIKGFIKTRENDSIGLVVFAEEAVLRLPVTIDHGRIISELDKLTLSQRDDGTAIGMGLALGVLHLSESIAKEKIILLITDGDNNRGEIQPETAANMASQMGIRIYAIGLGSSGEVPVEYVDDESGKIITGTLQSSFDKMLLEDISEISRGGYFYARSSGSLETIFKIIDSLETHEVKTKTTVEKRRLHREAVMLGGFIFFLYLLIRRTILGGVL